MNHVPRLRCVVNLPALKGRIVMKFRGMLIIVLASVWFVGGCATTKLTDVWKDPQYKAGPVQKILVLAVSKEPKTRKMFEGVYVSALNGAGSNAVASHKVLPGSDKLEKDEIKKAASDAGCDSVIVTHLVGIEQKEVHQAAIYDRRVYGGYDSFGNQYAGAYDYVAVPGTTIEQELVRLETNLYDLKSEKLIWRATSKTVEPGAIKSFSEEVSQLLVKSLQKNKLIGVK